jgi:TonB family protein
MVGLSIVGFLYQLSYGDDVERKVIYRVSPVYPQDLKGYRIAGMVRLEVMISPKGSVDSVVLLGGNPMFVDAAVAAVKKWRYAPAETKSKREITLTFNPE